MPFFGGRHLGMPPGNHSITNSGGKRTLGIKKSNVQVGLAISGNWLYLSRSTNFESVKKLKLQSFLSSNSTSNFGWKYFSDLWNVRKIKR